MRFSVWPSYERPWSEVVQLARWAEDAGWHGLWYADHLMPNTDDGSPAGGAALECWTVLAALAPITTTLRLGSLVSPVTLHHPVILAKRAVTVDHVSGGRVVLGLGAGWQVNEHAATGIELPAPKTRVDRFEEAIEIVARVRDEERVTTTGSWFRATDLPFDPKPVQQPMPIMVGTSGPRMARITARWADEWNSWGDPDTLRDKVAVLTEACDRVGRDVTTLRKSAQALIFFADDESTAAKLRAAAPGRALVGSAAQLTNLIGSYAQSGVDEFIVPDFNLGGTQSERFDAFARILEVLNPLR